MHAELKSQGGGAAAPGGAKGRSFEQFPDELLQKDKKETQSEAEKKDGHTVIIKGTPTFDIPKEVEIKLIKWKLLLATHEDGGFVFILFTVLSPRFSLWLSFFNVNATDCV